MGRAGAPGVHPGGAAATGHHTVSASGTYAEAAELATEWGVAVDDSTLHALVAQLGARAEAQRPPGGWRRRRPNANRSARPAHWPCC